MADSKIELVDIQGVTKSAEESLRNRINDFPTLSAGVFDQYLSDVENPERAALLFEIADAISKLEDKDKLLETRGFIQDLILMNFVDYLLNKNIVKYGDPVIGQLLGLTMVNKVVLKQDVKEIMIDSLPTEFVKTKSLIFVLGFVSLLVLGHGAINDPKKILEVLPYVLGMDITLIGINLLISKFMKNSREFRIFINNILPSEKNAYPTLTRVFNTYLSDLGES